MGAVYRASDTKLGRDVALKILPDSFVADPDRAARFAREAQILASLNHPNIAAIYGVEERALVLELVEGPTLAERIAHGPIPVEEALPIARQIAEALEYAHERGIIHRDLKPANVKVTAEGRVKVLDFGLAKALCNEPAAASPMSSPTLTMHATMLGTIIGTAAYMSPEQAKGKPVDRRADIWAFGVVLYEMLTGRRMYTGETPSETLAAVIKDTPDFTVLPEVTPQPIGWLLRRCLEKDPRSRLQAIGEARCTLEGREDLAPTLSNLPPARTGPVGSLSILAAVLGILAAALAISLWRATRPVTAPMLRFSADMGSAAPASPLLTAAISPDGRRIVYPMQTPTGVQLATRLLDQNASTILPGTEDAALPFFSPDGHWLGFFAAGKLKKVSVQGGAAVTLSESAFGPRGGWWGEDGTIIATLDILHLFRVPAAGGRAEMLPANPAVNGYTTYRWPQILPGGEAVLVTAGTNPGEFELADIGVIFLQTGRFKLIAHGGYYGRYLPSGHVIYIHEGSLYGVPFDTRRMEIRALPVVLLQDVAGHPTTGAGELDFSRTGTLVYQSGKGAREWDSAVWMDASGRQTPLFTAPGANMTVTPRISADGKRLAVGVNGDISVYDIARDTLTRITFNHAPNEAPVWTPDGQNIVYSGPDGIWWTRADGSGQPQRLLESKGRPLPSSFSPDGKRLAFNQAALVRSVWILPLEISDADHPKPGQPELFEQPTASGIDPVFSPDGRWLAYTSLESPLPQVYVRPYPAGAAGGAQWQISTSPAHIPAWSRNGRELFYLALDGHIMVVDYTTQSNTFSPGKPRVWCPKTVLLYGAYPHLDLAPDGKRFAVLPFETPDANANLHLTFLLNFFDELKRRMP
jgi:serine/threonine-protein kinase